MFLDDELLQICEQAKITSSKDVFDTAGKVYNHCAKYLQKNICAGTPKSEAYVTINKSFKLFDSFVEKLKGHKTYHVRGFYGLFNANTWKKQFLNTDNGKALYEDCKKYHKIDSSWN